ncbi:MAG: lamin tail domain-containing protein, partial [Phycisphaerales bacterium]|nr:lamin tail domain-containing protein [Phycisphaerales bacterium]
MVSGRLNVCRFVSVAAVLALCAGASAQTIVQWTFNNTLQNVNSPPPSTGIGTATLVGGATATFATASSQGGSTDTTVAPGLNFGWNTSTYHAQSVNTPLRAAQFAASTVGYDNIVTTWDTRLSSSCSRYVEYFYSIDGVNFVPTSPRTIFVAPNLGDTWANGRSVDLSGVLGVANNPNFAFRVAPIFATVGWTMQIAPNTAFAANTAYQPTNDGSLYGTGGSGGGTFRFDMVTISGTARPFAPIAAAVTVSPTFGCASTGTQITIDASINPGQNPVSTNVTVTADLSQVGGSNNASLTSNDGGATFSLAHTVPSGLTVGSKSIVITARDAENRISATTRTVNLVDCNANSGQPVVISQVYGGGGNLGPPAGLVNADFIEIYNRSANPVSLDGYSIQYIDAGNSAGFDDIGNLVPLFGTIKPGQYKLVRFSGFGATGAALPPADFVRSTVTGGLSSAAGRVALVNGTGLIGINCSGNASNVVVDFVGYGAAAVCFEGAGATGTLTNETAAIRKNAGVTDSNQNFADFAIGAPNPRNRASGGFLAGFASGSATRLCNGESFTLSVEVVPGAAPVSTGISVVADLSSLGGSASQALTNSGGNVYTFTLPVASATEGNQVIAITTSDANSRTDATTLTISVGNCTPSPATVVISKVYGGGGSNGSLINADFVELKNRTDAAIDLAGWSIQYASNTGVNGFSQVAPLAGVIPAQGYFLIRMSPESSGLPLIFPPDFVTTPLISGIDNSSGRVLLANNTVAVGNAVTGSNVVDFVGYGTAITFEGVASAPRINANAIAERKNFGCQDTN